VAIRRAPDTPPNRATLLVAAGLVLGVVSTLLNVTWMRTRRHL